MVGAREGKKGPPVAKGGEKEELPSSPKKDEGGKTKIPRDKKTSCSQPCVRLNKEEGDEDRRSASVRKGRKSSFRS